MISGWVFVPGETLSSIPPEVLRGYQSSHSYIVLPSLQTISRNSDPILHTPDQPLQIRKSRRYSSAPQVTGFTSPRGILWRRGLLVHTSGSNFDSGYDVNRHQSTLLPSWQEPSLKSRFRSPIGEKLRELTAAIQALTLLRPARGVK